MKQSQKLCRLISVCLIFAMNSFLLSACESDLFFDFAIEWAEDQSIYDGNGNINYGNLGNKIADDALDDFFGGSSAIQLQNGSVVNDVRKADDLAQQGAISGDVNSIEEAIHLRPNDWSYTEMRSAVYLAQGEVDLFYESNVNSNNLVWQSVENGADCVVAYRNFFQHRVEALQQQLDLYPGNRDIATNLILAQYDLANPEETCEEYKP